MSDETTPKRDKYQYLSGAFYSNSMEDLHEFLALTTDVNAPVGQGRSTPLMHAAKAGRTEMVRLLVEHGAALDVTDRWGRTALQYASAREQAETVLLLLDLGADPAGVNIDNTALLHCAIKSGHFDTIKALLDRGADPNGCDERGRTPLVNAVSLALFGGAVAPDERVVRLLLERGAAIDGHDQCETTPLMFASFVNSVEMVKLLLAEGADVNATTSGGVTALSFARLSIALSGHNAESVIDLLYRAGATDHGIVLEMPEPYCPILRPNE